MLVKSFEISVLIPTIARKLEALRVLLQSIAQQDFDQAKFEILVILNGSESKEKLTEVLQEFSFLNLQLVQIDQYGVNAARAVGMQKALGNLILMLDDDVELPDENYFSKVLHSHTRSPEVTAVGGMYRNKRNYSILDRIYNLDAHLSLISSKRASYSVDLLGGCVAYKTEKLRSYGILPNAKLSYGASESEFHHRLFRAGALLKFDRRLSVYHRPEMSAKDYCIKAYRQGRGFKNFCLIQNGAKKSVPLGWRSRQLLSLREFCYTWGRGELPIVRLYTFIKRTFAKHMGHVAQTASECKWSILEWYGKRIDQKYAFRKSHYESSGHFLISSSSEITSPSSFSLANAWPRAKLESLTVGMSLVKFSEGQLESLAIDVSKAPPKETICYWIEKFSDRSLSIYCSNEALTPYELKRSVDNFVKLLGQTKYKNKLRTLRLIQSSKINRWPEPTLLFEGENRSSNIKFSMVIPFYNNSQLLEQVVQSLLAQNYSQEKYEVVLVSDGSATEHLDVIHSLVSRQRSLAISLIHWDKAKAYPKEFRAGMARQIGSMFAKGEYLAFLDSDILVPPNYLAELEKSFEVYDIVQAKRRMLTAEVTQSLIKKESSFSFDSESSFVYKEEAYWENFKNSDSWEKLWAYWKYTCTYSLSLRRNTFFKLGGFHADYNRYGFEDVDLGYRSYLARLRFGFATTDVFHLYPQGTGALHHFNIQQREKMLVQSCETFYRLNLSPSLFQEFEFFLQGRNFKYQSVYFKDFTQFLWWKGLLLSFGHSMRLKSSQWYWTSNDLVQKSQGGIRRYLISLFWKTHVLTVFVVWNVLYKAAVKPYYMLHYQWNKRVLMRAEYQGEAKNGFAKERL